MVSSRPLAVLSVTVLAGLALGACSSSGGAPAKPVTQAQLESTLLRAGDLPAEWKTTPHDSSDDTDSAADKAQAKQLATCLGVPANIVAASDKDDAKQVYSPDFDLQNSSVSSQSEPDSEGGLDDAITEAALTSSKASGCLETSLRTTLTQTVPSSVTIGSIDAKVVKRSASQPAEVKFSFEAQVQITSEGNSATVYVTEANLAGNGVHASIDLDGFGSPIPSDVSSAAISAVAKRIDAV